MSENIQKQQDSELNTQTHTAASNVRESVGGSTTYMNTESEMKQSRRMGQTNWSDNLYMNSSAGYKQDMIQQFLAKPILNTTTWGSGSPEATVLSMIDLPGSLFISGAWSKKLEGFMAVRGTFNIRVQVNAQPFMGGRLLICYVPQGDMDFNQSNYRANGLLRASQLPGVQLDILHESEVTLEIPYVAPVTHYPLVGDINDRFTWGRVYIIVYSSLRASGAVSVPVSTWINMSQVELIDRKSVV